MHVNSITRSIEVYQALAQYAVKIIFETGIKLSYIDIRRWLFLVEYQGRLLHMSIFQEIKNILSKAVDEQETFLIIEPGSAAIGSAVELHTTVLDVKDTIHGRIVTTDGVGFILTLFG